MLDLLVHFLEEMNPEFTSLNGRGLTIVFKNGILGR